MDSNIDNLFKEIKSDIPKINPNLSNKIYEKAILKDNKSCIPFFKKPIILTFTSIIAVLFVLLGIFNLSGFNKDKNEQTNNPSNDNQNNSSVITNPFVPTLSPSSQSTVFIDYHYTIYTSTEDLITVIINNKINYQKIYLKAYNLEIDDINLNNGDVEIKKVIIEDQVFFEIVLDNTNTSIHYLDLSFKKGTISNILENQNNFMIKFIMYINEIDQEKGYGYDFEVNNVFDLEKGDCQ